MRSDLNYQEWDKLRREISFDTAFDLITVKHGDYESCMWYGNTGGRIIASWYTATGQCSVMSIDRIANAMAEDTKNYILNARVS